MEAKVCYPALLGQMESGGKGSVGCLANAESVVHLKKVTKKKRIDPLNSGEVSSKLKRKTRQTERKWENTSAILFKKTRFEQFWLIFCWK